MASSFSSLNTSATSLPPLTTATVPVSSTSAFTSHLNFNLPIKLDRTNYLFWKAQVLPAIRAYNLEEYIFESKPAPNKYIVEQNAGTSEVTTRVSDEFLAWKKNDQLLVCRIISTISEQTISQVTSCTTAHEVWTTLEKLYSQQSKSRILQLRSQLQTTKKGAMNMTNYILKMKGIFDCLTAAGQFMTEQDLLLSILSGLGVEYDLVVIYLTARQDQINLSEAQFLLLTQEQRLEQLNAAASIKLSSASAHFASGDRKVILAGTLTQVLPTMLHRTTQLLHRNLNTKGKDMSKRRILLKGTLRDGLYKVDLSRADSKFFPFLSKCDDSVLYLSQFSVEFGSMLDVVDDVNNLCSVNTLSCVDPASVINNKHTSSSSSGILDSWHVKLGHPSINVVKQFLKMSKIPFKDQTTLSFCDSCKCGKMHQLPFPTSQTKATHPLELVYSDVWGPAPVLSTNGYRYYLHFVDSFTRYTWIYPLHSKFEVFTIFKQFKNLVELQFDRKLKVLQTDWGGEYRPLSKYLADLGVVFRHPCPHTHQQNGLPERKHRHIAESGLAMLAHAQLPLTFWWDDFEQAVFLINQLPTPVLHHHTPFEMLYSKKSNLSLIKPFGCSALNPQLCLRSKLTVLNPQLRLRGNVSANGTNQAAAVFNKEKEVSQDFHQTPCQFQQTLMTQSTVFDHQLYSPG
ncbi:hypothetical protein ACOSQ4_021859 [Xanthoceras sorbifolium]